MRRLVSLSLGIPLAALLASLAFAKDAAPPPPADPLVVHEWGTFTSVEGADGLVLEGVAHEEEPLPAFVYSRSKVRACPLRAHGYKGLEVPVEHATQKMETPVLYFHTKTPRRLRVRVDFVKGLLSQWYPVTDLLGPPEGACDAGPLDLSKVDRSFLEWEVDLLPEAKKAAAVFPAVAEDDPWAFARRVDAAAVRTVPRHDPGRMGPTEAERFLFYRGFGTFALPFKAVSAPDGSLSFVNGSGHVVSHVVAVQIGEGGREGRFSVWSDVGVGATVPAAKGDGLLRGKSVSPWKESKAGLPALEAEVAKILVEGGMAPDEAQAMVSTWSRSWFSSEGTRVLYVVPRPLVDALLPLRIDPKPDAIERVLVGRIEAITPATQAEIEKAIGSLASADPATRAAAEARLDRLGRFLEPHLNRVIASTKDAAVRKTAEMLLPSVK